VSADAVVELQSPVWGATYVPADDLELLARLTGLGVEQCSERIESYRLEELASAWNQRAPRRGDEIRAFYSTTDHYLWELLGWNGSSHYRSYRISLDRLAQHFPPTAHPRALDWGCGVGTAALRLAELGYAVTIADVPGMTLQFARARFERRGIPVDVLEVIEDAPRIPEATWDVVVCFDVLEHVSEPALLAETLVRSLRPNGGAAIVAAFDVDDERWPHHLPSGRARFAGLRWNLFLDQLGLAHVDNFVYRRTAGAEKALRQARYGVWRLTGLHVHRLPR
jgi:2-polyprenyl-3-methyl-5-hydroxy-6-metoxy-1,4-benzoquinol methylase